MYTDSLSFPGILSAEYKSNPYLYINRLDKSENIIYDKTLTSYLAVSYDAVRYVLTNANIFTTKPLAERAEPVMRGKVLAQMEGNEHKIKRRIVLHEITGKLLKEYYAPFLYEFCDSLIEQLTQKKSFNFVSDFANKYALFTTFMLTGINYDQQNWFFERLKKVAAFATGFGLSLEKKNEYLLASEELEQAIRIIINKKRSLPDKDIISSIINENKKGMLISDSEIVALVLNILLAATEPVDKVLSYCIYHLYRNEAVMQRLINSSCGYNNILQETLRITPPVHLIPRLVEKDTNFEGVEMKKGNVIFSLIPSANRDDKYFTEPDTFDPFRPFKGHLSYGAGMHTCLGAQFANMQLSIAIEKLLPIIQSYKESAPPDFKGIYTRGATEYFLEGI